MLRNERATKPEGKSTPALWDSNAALPYFEGPPPSCLKSSPLRVSVPPCELQSPSPFQLSTFPPYPPPSPPPLGRESHTINIGESLACFPV